MSGTSRRLWLLVVVAGLCLSGQQSVSAQAAKPQAPKTELEGTWDGELSIGGGRTRTFAADEMWVTFKGNTVVGKKFLAPEGTESRFLLDSKAAPKHFDFIQAEGNPLRGIYQVEGDSLTIVISLTGARPSGFKESDQTFRVSILKLKRRK
jgi:uncharacterized protein (TIGR03067 family)